MKNNLKARSSTLFLKNDIFLTHLNLTLNNNSSNFLYWSFTPNPKVWKVTSWIIEIV